MAVGDRELRAKLAKLEELFRRAGSPGERAAAEAAIDRLQGRLREPEDLDPEVELKFSLPDGWSVRLFIAVCRKHGLRPFRVSALGRAAATVIRAVSGLPRRIAAARRARRTRTELAGLSDAMLDDIGLARGEIETIVEAVRRSPGQDPLVTLGHRAPGAEAPTHALPLPRQVIGRRRPRLGHAPTVQDGAPRAA